jgi:cytochrome b pre-mRNA-processing protein 3
MIFGLFRRSHDESDVRAIYSGIMAHARHPAFYQRFGVPDTLDGRYDMLMLHAFLYLHRLKAEPEAVRGQGQKVFDLMFLEMDRALREIGVGDLAVPKKIKKMASAFYGRTAAYDEALDGTGPELAEALRRNIYAGDDAGLAPRLGDYVRHAAAEIAGQGSDRLVRTGPVFPDPAPFAEQKSAAR